MFDTCSQWSFDTRRNANKKNCNQKKKLAATKLNKERKKDFSILLLLFVKAKQTDAFTATIIESEPNNEN